MSKKSRRRSSRRERVTVANATPRVRRVTAPVYVTTPRIRLTPLPPSPLFQLEDRRQWHPETINRPVRATRRSATRVVVKDRLHNPYSQTKGILVFQDPQKISLCARRQVRKRVLHAINKNGRNGQRTRKLNPQSSISCRS